MKRVGLLLAAILLSVFPTYAQSQTGTWSSKNFESSIARPGFWNDGSGIFVEEMSSPDAGILAGVFHEGNSFVVLLGLGIDKDQHSFTITPQAVTLESGSGNHLVLFPLPYPDPQIRKDSLEVKMQFKKEIEVKKAGDYAVAYLFFPYDDKASQVTVVVEVKNTTFRFPFSRDPNFRAKFIDPEAVATATPASQQSAKTESRPASKTPAQVLDENRGSIAVIVAAGNTTQKLGTGFYVQSTGLLLTNFHVVEGAEIVGVKMKEASSVQWAKRAKGFDLDNDLVALQVETTRAKPVMLGDSDQVRVGEQIVVIGNPEGLEQTISNGLISGIREVDGRKLFQISAPISPGSSGSPVFNERGEVIGVVVSSLESGQNLNFAVPINYVKLLLTSMNEGLISSLPKPGVHEQIDHSARKSQQPETPNGITFPKQWTHVRTGATITIRMDGDHIYEEGSFQDDSPYFQRATFVCDTQNQGGQWIGKCNYKFTLFSGQQCPAIGFDEIITMVSPQRIEGDSQSLKSNDARLCPVQGSGRSHFVMIPKD